MVSTRLARLSLDRTILRLSCSDMDAGAYIRAIRDKTAMPRPTAFSKHDLMHVATSAGDVWKLS
jgi:hypothetical protein